MFKLKAVQLGIDTLHQPVVYLHHNCHVCHSEGLNAQTRVNIASSDGTTIIAIVNIVSHNIVGEDEVGLSKIAYKKLGICEGDSVYIKHASALESLSFVRRKIYGDKLNSQEMLQIVQDIAQGRFSDIHLSSFVTACTGNNLSNKEVLYLTKAMVQVGSVLTWDNQMVLDKHCVGGLPGNRTTPIIVAITAACGLTMPKTSSRAITSPAGTADTMEVITNVNIPLSDLKQVVNDHFGCLCWGGAVSLSPADDILIRIERALDIDSDGQLVASVLSKKIAAGSTHVLIDIPVGPTAKVRNHKSAIKLASLFEYVASQMGLTIKVTLTDGSEPIGCGVGPALEAIDVLNVLRNSPSASTALRERAVFLSGQLLELAEVCKQGEGELLAQEKLNSGAALICFKNICLGQGRFSEPVIGKFNADIRSLRSGVVTHINNRTLARIAKLAGAPACLGAGVLLKFTLGSNVLSGDILFTVYAESPGELEYALQFYNEHKDAVVVEEEIL